jgi:hypothetical protein
VLGHARSLQAIHGGKATHDTIDAQNIAVRRRGGRRPPAEVSPAAMRATRDLRRRRMHLARTRGARLAHGHTTHSPSHLPAIGNTLADQPHRDGVAERVAEPAVPQRLAGDRARIGADEARRRDVERTRVNTATPHDAQTLELRPTGPGLGTILRLVRRDDIHQLDRCPRVQDVASDGRLGTWAKASAGQRAGTSGTNRGQAPLAWACADAAVGCWREHPAGQKFLARLAKQHRPGQAVTILAHQLARAVSNLFTRNPAVALHTCLPAAGRGVGELHASRDSPGMSRFLTARHGVFARPGASRA